MEEHEIEIPGSFRGLDPNLELQIYRRNLPHWRQDGATYFVTFRLEDALPQLVLQELEAEKLDFRQTVERLHLEGAALRTASDNFFRNYGRLMDRHLDAGAGSCVLRDAGVSKLVIETMTYFDGERYDLYSAVVMPNHCHVMIRPFSQWPLEGVLKSWKGYSAKEVNRRLGWSGSLWQSDSFDRIVRDHEHYRQVVRYIRMNPRKANLPPGEYRIH